MPHSIVMPALEMGQETGKLVAWLKKDGETVTRGEPLFEVETDKAVLEVEAPADGILAGITAKQGDVILVGKTIAWIVNAGEDPPVEASTQSLEAGTAAAPAVEMVARDSKAPAAAGVRISPKASRLAKENGVDLAVIRGSGAGGEILTSDIEAVLQHRSAFSQTGGSAAAPMSTIARLMAERTAQSWTTVPHIFLTRDVEATRLIEAREDARGKEGATPGVRVSHTDLLVALTSRVLAIHPSMNASWSSEGVKKNDQVNIAIAIAVEDGVVSGVIHNANTLRLIEISALRKELSERARARSLRPADIAGATFTISNLGMYEVDSFSAIINPPQSGILAVGRIRDRVVPVDGKPAVRPVMTVTLSSDHRVVDGAQSALFLKELADAFNNPGKWLA